MAVTNLNSAIASAFTGLSNSVQKFSASASNIVQSTAFNNHLPDNNIAGVASNKNPYYIENPALASEVSFAEEIINMKIAQNSYQANIQTIKTIDSMSKQLIDIVS